MSKKIVFCLLMITVIGIFFHFYKINQSPPCLNADEAAFGYNAYSLLKTGKDEYGNLLPVRLKSFADNKMPLITYLTIPFISVFGLNEFSIKLLNAVIMILFPTTIYLFSFQLFKNKKISLLAALLFVLSWSIQSLGRQLHEALPTSFLVLCTAYFLLKSIEKKNSKFGWLYLAAVFVSLFSYQSSRIFVFFFFILTFYFCLIKKLHSKFLVILFLILLVFGATDIIYKPQRVTNLLFFNNRGFSLKIDEFRADGGPRWLYNKLTIGIKDIISEHLKYYSPQFLAINGDSNYRFGYPGLSPITVVEYLFFFVGIYYLFKNKEKWRLCLLGLLLISSLPASLSWNSNSLTRSFFILIPIFIISSYGMISLIESISLRNRLAIFFIITLSYGFFAFYNWDFYLNYYPKRGVVTRAWQCGYRQLADYIKNNYYNYKQFYITKSSGQPYIFLLFFLKYPPEKYQKQALLSGIDEYGFGQVEKFDKFIFHFENPDNKKGVAIIGAPEDFINGTDRKTDFSSLKKIKIGNEEVFWIQEIKQTE